MHEEIEKANPAKTMRELDAMDSVRDDMISSVFGNSSPSPSVSASSKSFVQMSEEEATTSGKIVRSQHPSIKSDIFKLLQGYGIQTDRVVIEIVANFISNLARLK